MGSDELGCNGCDRFQYSCSDDEGDTSSTCYSSVEKCDGYRNCQNGKDERDCSMIVQQLGSVSSYSASHLSGILHRNYKGRWYPVCKQPTVWAVEACEAENGSEDFVPILSIKSGPVSGPFISRGATDMDQSVFSDFCRYERNQLGRDENHLIHVRCGNPKCGISKIDSKKEVRRKRQAVDENQSPEVQSARIVGGSSALPAEYPFIVAIFKDGKFHCGGTIYNELWIITGELELILENLV